MIKYLADFLKVEVINNYVYDDEPRNGYGFSDGSGNGSGYCSGDGFGYGSGNGNGSGEGYGNGSGDCDGSGCSCFNWDNEDYSIKKINNQQVISIDNVLTIIENIHGNYAKGYILKDDLTITSCFIAKYGDYFAHGKTLAEARKDAQAKYEKCLPIDKRIELFNEKYPDNDTPIDGNELFDYHNKLTGSCLFGRQSFCQERGLDLNTKYTVREFISITEDAYGNEVINKLKKNRGL